jgi:hypothetical protein
VVEHLEPNLAQSHTVEGFFCHEAGCFGAIASAPDIFLPDDDAKERRHPVPAADAVGEGCRAHEALALAFMDREAGAACRRRQDERFKIAARLRWGQRLEIVTQELGDFAVCVPALKCLAVCWNVRSQGNEPAFSHQGSAFPVPVVQPNLRVRRANVESAP